MGDSRDIDLSAVKEERVSVYLRLRPTSEAHDVYSFDSNKVTIQQSKDSAKTSTEKIFSFTSIVDEDVEQIEMYEKTVQPVLNQLEVK